jgi:hypothetical protein
VPKINFFIQNIHFAAKFASTLTLLSGAAAALAPPHLSCAPEGGDKRKLYSQLDYQP